MGIGRWWWLEMWGCKWVVVEFPNMGLAAAKPFEAGPKAGLSHL